MFTDWRPEVLRRLLKLLLALRKKRIRMALPNVIHLKRLWLLEGLLWKLLLLLWLLELLSLRGLLLEGLLWLLELLSLRGLLLERLQRKLLLLGRLLSLRGLLLEGLLWLLELLSLRGLLLERLQRKLLLLGRLLELLVMLLELRGWLLKLQLAELLLLLLCLGPLRLSPWIVRAHVVCFAFVYILSFPVLKRCIHFHKLKFIEFSEFKKTILSNS